MYTVPMLKRLFASSIGSFLGLAPLAALAAVELTNPLGDTTDVREIIARVINGAIAISGSIALLMFVYGGLVWLASMGRPDWIEKGRKTLTWSIIGITVVALAYIITYTIFAALLTGSTEITTSE